MTDTTQTRDPILSQVQRLRIDALVDVFMGLGLAVAALIRHSQTPEGTGPAEYLLWTFAVLAGVRAFVRATAVIAAQEKHRPDPRP